MKKIASSVYKEGYVLEWYTDFMGVAGRLIHNVPGTSMTNKNDIQVVLQTDKGKCIGDAVCRFGSYGVNENLWETMIAGDDDVSGYLTFAEVIIKFNKAIKKFESNRRNNKS